MKNSTELHCGKCFFEVEPKTTGSSKIKLSLPLLHLFLPLVPQAPLLGFRSPENPLHVCYSRNIGLSALYGLKVYIHVKNSVM